MALIHRFAFPGLQPPTDDQSASEPKMKLSTFLFLSLTTHTIALNPAKPLRRQDGPSLLCPVPCDSTWCCLTGQTCQENSNSGIPYACDDPLLQITEEPFALETFISVISSIESDVVSLGCSLEGVPSGSSCSITVTPSTSYTFETGLPTERPTPRPDNVVSSSTSSAGVGENGRRRGMDGGLLGAGLGMVVGWLV